MKPWLRLVIAVVVLAGVIGWLYYPSKPAPAAAPAKPLVTLNTGDVQGVTITQPNVPDAVVTRTGTAWTLSKPYAYPADSSAITSLVSGLGNITDATDVGSSSNLSAFGLDKPSLVTLDLGGGKTMTFEFGGESPTGGNTYMRVGDSGPIKLVPDYVKQDALQTAFALQSKSILTFTQDQATSIDVSANGKSVHIDKTKDGWPKDQSQNITNLLDAVADAQMTAMPDPTGKDAAADGLAHPAMSLKVNLPAGPVTLQIGSKKGAAEYYARNSTNPAIFTISDYLIGDVTAVVTPTKAPTVTGTPK